MVLSPPGPTATTLAPSATGARLRSAGGKRTWTDGPFTESKELISYALYEEKILDPISGRVLNPNLEFYRLAGLKHSDDISQVLVENLILFSLTRRIPLWSFLQHRHLKLEQLVILGKRKGGAENDDNRNR